MKRLALIVLGGALLSAVSLAETKWGRDLEAAKKLSAKTGQLILVDFFAEWCGPCKQMDKTVFQGSDGANILKGFILVKQDVDNEGKKNAQKYEVTAMPTLHVMKADGKTVLMTVGGLDGETLKQFLAEAKRRATKKATPSKQKPAGKKASGSTNKPG